MMGEQEWRTERDGAQEGRVGGLDGKGPRLESGCEEGQMKGRRED